MEENDSGGGCASSSRARMGNPMRFLVTARNQKKDEFRTMKHPKMNFNWTYDEY